MLAVDVWSYSSSNAHSNNVVNLSVPIERWLQPKTGCKTSPWGFSLEQHSLTLVLVWLCLVACANLHSHHIPVGKTLLLKLVTGV